MIWLHLHTPIGLLRYGGSHNDVNPKYNSTCSDDRIGPERNMSACVGRNIADHLDYGVAPYLCEITSHRMDAMGRLSVLAFSPPDDGLWQCYPPHTAANHDIANRKARSKR